MTSFILTGPGAADEGLSANLAPNDHIPFTWSAGAFPADLLNVQGHITLDFDDPIPIWNSPPFIPILPMGTYSDQVPRTAAVYRSGLHSLHLSVSGQDAHGRPYEFGEARVLILVSRPLFTGALSWVTPPVVPHPLGGDTAINWRQPYQVAATLTHPTLTDTSAVVELNGTLNLIESNVEDHMTQTTPTPVTLGPVQPQTTLNFLPETPAWEWIIPVIYVVRYNQLFKTFIYGIYGTLEDQWHNRYYIQEQFVIIVSVPPWKVVAGESAFQGALVAAVLMALAIAAHFGGVYTVTGALALAAASAWAYGAASSAYLLAVDPPSPDPWFRERVEIVTTAPSPVIESDSALKPYRRFIEVAMRIPAIGTAISVVEGRNLGAEKAGDAASKSMQEDRLKELRAQWKADAVEVAQAANDVRELGTLDIASDVLTKMVAEIRQQGLSPDLRNAWTANALPHETLDALEKLLQTIDVSQLSTLSQMISKWSASLEWMANSGS